MRNIARAFVLLVAARGCDSYMDTSLFDLQADALIYGRSTNITFNKIVGQKLSTTPQSHHPCPEQLGAQAVSCTLCGGEDLKNKGHCGKGNDTLSQCQCVGVVPSKSLALPMLTTITATPSGHTQVVIGTYALQTISSYTKLRQNITTTLSASSTATDGSVGVETAVAVVLAGGAAWFLVGLAGDIAGEEVLKPPHDAPDHPDDRTCPVPKRKCSDCGGVARMCTRGDEAGCACEVRSCPSGESQPKCSNPQCASKDNKHCEGENKGCDCTPEEDCPTGRKMLECDDCGGAEQTNEIYGRCKGDPKHENRYKGCKCFFWIKGPDPYTTNFKGMIAAAKSFAKMGDVTPASYGKTKRKAVCQMAGYAAPQREPDGYPNVDNSISEWCKSVDGIEVKQGLDIPHEMYSYSWYSYWLSAGMWSPNCGKSSKIDKKDCEEALRSAMISCDPNAGRTHGASKRIGCLQYNITLSGETNPQSPPWKPLPASAAPQCDMKAFSVVHNKFFNGIYPQFCSDIDKGGKSKGLTKTLTNKDFKEIGKRTPPANRNQYEDFKFELTWTGGTGICRAYCMDAFQQIVKSPCGWDGPESNSMALRASLDVGCGTYKYEIKPPLKPVAKDELICDPSDTRSYVEAELIEPQITEICKKMGADMNMRQMDVRLWEGTMSETVVFVGHMGGDVPLTEQACNDGFRQVLDCNKKTDKNAAMFKHGGSNSIQKNAHYFRITPTKQRRIQVPADGGWHGCETKDYLLFKDFQMWGFGFADNDFGQEKLIHQIRGCGALTKWHFEYFPKAPCFADKGIFAPQTSECWEWRASGRLPIGPQITGCVNRAAISSGSRGAGTLANPTGGCYGLSGVFPGNGW